MNALVLLLDHAGSGGQVEQIARTFGVDWPHLFAQIVSFCIVCLLLYRFAYRPILQMLEARRQEIAQGLANAEQIKAELAHTEARRQEVMAQGERPGDPVHRGSPRRGRPSAGAGDQKAIAAAEQIMSKAREAAAQDRDRMLAELKQRDRPAGGADYHCRRRQDPDAGRSTAPDPGYREATERIAKTGTDRA